MPASGQNANDPLVLVKGRRRVVKLASQQLVSERTYGPDAPFPVVLEPATEGVDLLSWINDDPKKLEDYMATQGAVLFRGFKIGAAPQFERLVRSFSSELLEYFDQHTPRTRVSGGVYTSTEYPAEHHVPFHSENSKNHVWPMKIWFFCLQPAQQGGETPIADNRKVYQLIPRSVRERFIEKKVMYVRNFGDGPGLPWQTVFQTGEKTVVEDRCREAGMDWEWKDGDRLRIRHICQAVSRHPTTGELVWFNQAHLFHVSNLEPVARESVQALFREEDLPSNAYYGDGRPIEIGALDEIRAAYREASVSFPWREQDLLMLENMLIAHGRAPYRGARKVIVAMAGAYSETGVLI